MLNGVVRFRGDVCEVVAEPLLPCIEAVEAQSVVADNRIHRINTPATSQVGVGRFENAKFGPIRLVTVPF